MDKQKIKVYNNARYSRTSFPEYYYRAIVEFIVDGDLSDYNQHRMDIYTDATNRSEVLQFVENNSTAKVISFKIIHYATRAQDENAAAMIDEWLNEDKKENNATK